MPPLERPRHAVAAARRCFRSPDLVQYSWRVVDWPFGFIETLLLLSNNELRAALP